jgi:signal transduction histidine kinase
MDTQETKIFIAVLLAAGIVAVIILYFFVTIVRSQRRHLSMQQQFLLAEISTLEKERKRIVSDLHDDLGPLLSAVKMHVSCLDVTNHNDIQALEKANHHLDNIVERVRGICNDLVPEILFRKGLILAVEDFTAEFNSGSPMKIEFHHSNIAVHPDSEIHIYRMIQEITNNAVKHSKANLLTIELLTEKEKLILKMCDNGIGFHPDKISKHSTGYGLKNILSRTDILKGEMYLHSEPGKGTTYSIEIPNR